MRIVFLWIIKAYWFLIPPHKRNKCIFKESCSHYVFRITQKRGLIKGLAALNFRFKHCRPGYYIINGQDGKLLISARNGVFNIVKISESVLGIQK